MVSFLKLLQKSRRYTASKMWNSLPDESRKVKTYMVFLEQLTNIESYGTVSEMCDNFTFFYFLLLLQL